MSPIAVTKQLLSPPTTRRARGNLSRSCSIATAARRSAMGNGEDNARAYDRIGCVGEYWSTSPGGRCRPPQALASVISFRCWWRRRVAAAHPSRGELLRHGRPRRSAIIMSEHLTHVQHQEVAHRRGRCGSSSTYRDRALTRSLAERAEAAGYRAILLTVDAVISGIRGRTRSSTRMRWSRTG